MDYINQGYQWYKWTVTFADPRVADWPLVASPLPTIAIVCAYLFIILVAGPKYMSKRLPVEFGNYLPAYNFALVALNCYIVNQSLVGSWNAGYSYVCTPLRSDSYDPNEIMVANAVWWFYFSKILELFDTVLFMLRKRNRQISFLHVYHHSTMPLIWWIGVKWVPGGQSFFSVMLNSSVHVIMYTYYGLAAMGPKVQKYLWWKKYITIIQLIQFCVAIFHTARSLYVECPSPAWMHWALIVYAFSFIILFGNFYIQAYLSKPKSLKSKDSNGVSVANGNAQRPKKSEMKNDEASLRMRTRNQTRAREEMS